MRAVYEKVASVYAGLSPAADDSDKAMEILSSLKEEFGRFWSSALDNGATPEQTARAMSEVVNVRSLRYLFREISEELKASPISRNSSVELFR